jgi:peptidoglycan/xylan/chitin deacetylase (PgdA/CDA1 family)
MVAAAATLIEPAPVPVIRTVPLPGTVALTFDDGPDPTWTPVILDILKEHGAVATFFVIGRKVDADPDLARRIVAEGHSLQSHAYYHNALNRLSAASLAFHIDAASDAIYNATGTRPACLRPPAGKTSGLVAAVAAEHGHQIVLWTPAGNTGDYAHHSRSVILSRAAAWEPGEITLMHSNWGWLYRDVLGTMLDELTDRGIGFSTICVPEPIDPPPVSAWPPRD